MATVETTGDYRARSFRAMGSPADAGAGGLRDSLRTWTMVSFCRPRGAAALPAAKSEAGRS